MGAEEYRAKAVTVTLADQIAALRQVVEYYEGINVFADDEQRDRMKTYAAALRAILADLEAHQRPLPQSAMEIARQITRRIEDALDLSEDQETEMIARALTDYAREARRQERAHVTRSLRDPTGKIYQAALKHNVLMTLLDIIDHIRALPDEEEPT